MTNDLYSSEIIKTLDCPHPDTHETPTSYASRLSTWYKETFELNSTSQIFTPSIVAKYMARKCITSKNQLYVLDPGVGIGTLSSAIVEAFSEKHNSGNLVIDAIDIDSNIALYAKKSLDYAVEWAAKRGISVLYSIVIKDFLETEAFRNDNSQQALFPENETKYDVVIMNPPYSKISSSDSRVMKISKFAGKQSNTYSLFLSVALTLLKSKGKLVSINPRSFASGRYYQEFREFFFGKVRLREVHLFDSRRKVFPDDGILQEILIIVAETGSKFEIFKKVLISTSQCIEDLVSAKAIKVPYHMSITRNKDLRLALPTSKDDIVLLRRINRWKYRLSSFGLEISTGPIVPFRVREFLLKKPSKDGKSIPLLWMNNVTGMSIEWPQQNGKPDYFVNNDESIKHTVPSNRFVLLRRFSAKESQKRLTAAVVTDELMKYPRIGIENHVNFIHSKTNGLEDELAFGLAGLLNSSIMDRYFRILNGNTQVNVYDVELMPLPDKELLKQIGSSYLSSIRDTSKTDETIDATTLKIVDH